MLLTIVVVLFGAMFSKTTEPVCETKFTCEQLKELISLGLDPYVECTHNITFLGSTTTQVNYKSINKYYLENCFGEQQ